MKKIVLIALSLAVSLCAVSSFALTQSTFEATRTNDFEDADGVDYAEKGMTINDDEDAYGCTDFMTNLGQAQSSKTGYYVKNVPYADGQCIKVTNTQVLFPDLNYKNFYNNYNITCDIMPSKVTSFAGMLVDYTYAEGTLDAYTDPYPITEIGYSDADSDIANTSGWGFTFLKTSTTSIRVFVNYDTDVPQYLDIDLGLGDITTSWHTYSMYRLCNNSDGDQTAFILVDYVPVAKISGVKITNLLTGKSVNCDEIQDIGSASICFCGSEADGTLIYFDNVAANDENHKCSELSDSWIGNSNTVEEAATLLVERVADRKTALEAKRAEIAKREAEATAAPATAVPATEEAASTPEAEEDATAAPADEPTAVPAATEEAGKSEGGCGGMLCGSALIVLAAGLFVARKKK